MVIATYYITVNRVVVVVGWIVQGPLAGCAVFANMPVDIITKRP